MREFLRISTLEARDLPDAWFLAIKEVMEQGYEYTVERGSFENEQKRRELDMFAMLIKYPATRPLIPDAPPGRGFAPPTSMEYVEGYFNRYLMSGLRTENEEYTYGEDLETQIDEVIKILKAGKYNQNQTCMTVGNKNSILLKDPQCLKVLQVRVRYDKMHFIVYFRSWDLWGGFPANLAGLQLLKEYMAREVGLEHGCTVALSGGLHLYNYSWPFAEKVLGK